MPKATSFEKSVQELDSIVEKMESGELNLEQSLELFERGVKLTRECRKILDDAEKKIEILLESTKDLDS
ncbi:MAG: exodeoxyribonuclease VII small subunit [Gammaproteobacteria bacterium]|jgi:exodeoxyribonuclease VII small subunit|nr:exodeoxyribonuclease VII small subunit [Xanthomonadales bacterium]MCB1604312.1 exodeoxyribonuclease VII small subunit [Xanthomonadales bacterium]